MVWLTLAGGLPVGEWRMRIRLPGECSLYHIGTLQWAQHALYSCHAVAPVWERFAYLRSMIGVHALTSWEAILCGDLGVPLPPRRKVELADLP